MSSLLKHGALSASAVLFLHSSIVHVVVPLRAISKQSSCLNESINPALVNVNIIFECKSGKYALLLLERIKWKTVCLLPHTLQAIWKATLKGTVNGTHLAITQLQKCRRCHLSTSLSFDCSLPNGTFTTFPLLHSALGEGLQEDHTYIAVHHTWAGDLIFGC